MKTLIEVINQARSIYQVNNNNIKKYVTDQDSMMNKT